MINTIPPLFEDQRKREAEEYERNMQSMRNAMLMQMYAPVARKAHKGKGKGKNKGKSKIKSRVLPAVNTLRERLMQRQMMMMRPQTSYAQPYTSQQEAQLQKVKDQNSQAQAALNNYRTVIAQQQAETRKAKEALKAAKAQAREETRRAEEAERNNKALEQQKEDYRKAHERYVKATSGEKLSKAEMEQETLQAQIYSLEFETKKRKMEIKENKLGHSNQLLQQEVDQLTAERDAYDKILESDMFSKTVETQQQLLNDKMQLEHERDIKQRILKQRIENRDLIIKRDSYLTQDEINAINDKYYEEWALAVQENAKLKQEISARDDELYVSGLQKDAWKKAVRDKAQATADLGYKTNELEYMDMPEDDVIKGLRSDIGKLQHKIDEKQAAISGIKSKRSRVNKLNSKLDDLTEEKGIIDKYNSEMKTKNETIDDDITKAAKDVGEAQAKVAGSKSTQEGINKKHARYARMHDRLDSAKDDQTIEESKVSVMKGKDYSKSNDEITKVIKEVAANEVKLDQAKIMTNNMKLKENAANDLAIEESKQKVISSKDWMEKGAQLTQMQIDKARADELKRKQEILNQAEAQHIQDGLLERFYQLCSEQGMNLDYNAHEINNQFLNDAGITDPSDMTAIYTAIEEKRKDSSAYALERQRVSNIVKNTLSNMGHTETFNEMIEDQGLIDIRDPPMMPRSEFRALANEFAVWNKTPALFNDVFH